MKKYVHRSEYFYGNKISDYGLRNGYVDYATLAKSFDAVLNNNIISETDCNIGYWDQVNGITDNSEEINGIEDEILTIENEMDNIEDTESVRYINLEKERDKLIAAKEELEEAEQYCPEVYQYYIVSDNGARILQELTDEIVFYNDQLDMYVWGVTHWGTSWDHVLTDIKINRKEE